MSVHPGIPPPFGITTSIVGKRFKPIETCDNCKQRKVKCDKERPQCGTCRKSKRECRYELSASSKRGRPKNEIEILQEQIEEIQSVQYNQLNQVGSLLKMAVLPGSQGTMPMGGDNNAAGVNFFMPNNSDQINGNFPTNGGWDHPYSPMITEESPPPSLNLEFSGDALMFLTDLKPIKPELSDLPGLPVQDIPVTVPLAYGIDIGHPSQDPVDQLADRFESTLYVGPASLLTSEDDDEQIIPQDDLSDLSSVDAQLKILPNQEIAERLIDVYYQTMYRHYPHLKKKVVIDCYRQLSRPEHFLLLNSIFFAASPFFPNPNKELNDRGTYYERALALLQLHCLKTPHVLTVISLFILGLHVRMTGTVWILNGIVSKMIYELGLHRKVKNNQISDEVKELRDMAFWGFFASETWVSACYGRPSAIDESTCDVDLLPIPPDQVPDEETRLHIAWILHINLLRIFAQENQFRFLDATLGRWFYTLPHWLKFEEMAQDPRGSLLGAIGVLILLHSRNLTMFTSNNSLDDSSRISSQTICVHAAIILLHCLDVLINTVPDFYEQTCTALFSFAPAIRVLSWIAQRGDSKAELMVLRLKQIKEEVAEIARRRYVDQPIGEGRLDGEVKLKGNLTQIKTFEEQAMYVSEQQKDNLYISKDKKYRKSPKLPMWGDDNNNFTFTFNLPDNFNSSTLQYLTPQNPIGGDQQNFYQQSTNDDSVVPNIFYDSTSQSNLSTPIFTSQSNVSTPIFTSQSNASTPIFTSPILPQDPDSPYQQSPMPIFSNNNFNNYNG
ncbi:32202_t:CDS:10 [Gigaspora margarita]|uniref:32202_t:CDS:1 n=1 Tax=Gigaspora margarita TaxID=4874 RepID=A0ABN7V8B2_GIGMA|nr:32202_t:CDS:10 [Gigaspora margarita]